MLLELGTLPADLRQTSGRPPADFRQTSGRPPGSIASSLGSGAFLRPPRVGFSASAGFSASTGLSTFLAPRLKFFVYFRDLVLDLERSLSPDLDLERLLERSF